MITQPEHAVAYRLADGMSLKGYTLPQTQVMAGERLQLQLFWEVDRDVDTRRQDLYPVD